MKKRILSMLVLLAAVVSGAWATTPNSIVINGTPQVGDKSISLTYHFDPNNVPGISSYAPTLKVKCAADNKWDEMALSLGDISSGTTSISLNNLGEFEAGKTYDVCFAYYNGTWVDDVFQTFVPAGPPTYAITLAEGTEDAENWNVPAEAPAGSPVTVTYSGEKKVKSVKAVKNGGEIDPLAVPLTIEAITAGIISIEKPKVGMQYSLNGGAKTTMTGTTTFEVAAGDKVAFYGKGTEITSYGSNKASGCTKITGISGMGFTCKVYGNIMSLVDEEGFATATTLSGTYNFKYLFYGNAYLTDASGLLLPATQLASYCYYSIFYGCTALTAAPVLPATQLASNCYYQMFYGCSALTAAPELPAETLASYCYYQMFRGCSSLTATPELPAPTLVNNCYEQMFYGCSKLATVTCLATSGINEGKSTSSWIDGAGSQVDGTKTFNAVSTANWPSGVNGIPTGWSRVNVDN